MIKLRHLESALQSVDPFDNPKVNLEQVPTSPHIAAHMISTAISDIQESVVADFGCGTGMLSIGCSLVGSLFVIGVELDNEAIETAWVNTKKLEVENIDLVKSDIQSMNFNNDVDTVVMNPPFGTRKAGIDTVFVKQAMKNASVVYSLHKSSTRKHFVKLASESGWQIEVLAELRYDIPKTFRHHREKSKDIEVDFYRFTHTV